MQIASEKDSRGMIYVDCSECRRGVNGDIRTCSAGMKKKYKKPFLGGCFNGELMPEIKAELEKQTAEV